MEEKIHATFSRNSLNRDKCGVTGEDGHQKSVFPPKIEETTN